MKKIISASYKDDTPAFFSEEFFENVRRGFAMVNTKYGPKAVSLLPKDVHCFVFWTKNCSDHFLANMQTLKSPFYIQWTITGYDTDSQNNLAISDKRKNVPFYRLCLSFCPESHFYILKSGINA